MKYDEFYYHEIMDRCHVIESMMESHLRFHPAMTEKQRRKIEKAEAIISEVYQWASDKEDKAILHPPT